MVSEVQAAFPAWDIVIGAHEVWKPNDFLARLESLGSAPDTRVAVANETHV